MQRCLGWQVSSSGDGPVVLYWAARVGQVQVIKELIGRRCDVNAVRANRCTPLHDAAASGRAEAVCQRINLGAVVGEFGFPLYQADLNGDNIWRLLKPCWRKGVLLM